MNKSQNPHFTERLNASAAAKKLELERAALARSVADSPAAAERRAARGAIRAARDARVAERKATKAATEAREAAALLACCATNRMRGARQSG
jgi:hypothetical protein